MSSSFPPFAPPLFRTVLCCALVATLGCSDDDSGARTGSGGAGGSGAGTSSGGSGGSTGGTASNGFATQVPIADTLQETADGALAGDASFAIEFCGDADDPATLKPIGTVVRVKVSQRYFMCIGDLGSDSVDLIQTNIPSDPVQGFVPYAALFVYQDPERPNLERPSKGPENYGLLVINLLNDEPSSAANSACSGSNAVFDDLRIGGADQNLCRNVPSALRIDGDRKFVDVVFPGGQSQSFELEPIPFTPPG